MRRSDIAQAEAERAPLERWVSAQHQDGAIDGGTLPSHLRSTGAVLRQALTTSSLDAPVNGDEGRSFLGDLIADNPDEEPLDRVERGIHQEQLGRWLSHLSDQEREVLRLRFGLDGEERHTLAEIGRRLEVSRERVRQVELKALRKLRNLTRRLPSGL